MSDTRDTRSLLERKHLEARAFWLRSERDAGAAREAAEEAAKAYKAYKALKAATRKVAK